VIDLAYTQALKTSNQQDAAMAMMAARKLGGPSPAGAAIAAEIVYRALDLAHGPQCAFPLSAPARVHLILLW
jgi:nitrogenase molybdenum-iron protein alpha/beta subunit